MSIAEAREKCKSIAARMPRDVLMLGILVLASTLSFGLGYLAGIDASGGGGMPETPPLVTGPAAGQVVASRSGTKYYLPSCAGAGRIAEANKVWFASAAAAASAGYAPAANCSGL